MMSNLSDKRVNRTKRDLKLSFVELCNQKNVQDISVSDIVDHAGYSRSTFYAHYDSKTAFLVAFLDDEINYYINNYISSFKAINHQQASQIANEALFTHVYQNKSFYQLLFSEEFKKSLNVKEYFLKKVVDTFISTFDIQFKDTVIDTSIDRELYISCNVETYLTAIAYWIKIDFKYSPAYMVKQMHLITKNSSASIYVRRD